MGDNCFFNFLTREKKQVTRQFQALSPLVVYQIFPIIHSNRNTEKTIRAKITIKAMLFNFDGLCSSSINFTNNNLAGN